MKVTDSRVKSGQDYLLLRLKGNLHASGKSIALNLYFGSTDASGPVKPSHWPYVLDSLRNDDFLFFYGHAGLGANLSMQKLSEQMALSPSALRDALAAPKAQLIAVLTANANAYFGRDIGEIRQTIGRGQRTDLILSAGLYFPFRPRFFGDILRYLDEYLAGKASPWRPFPSSHVGDRGMITISSLPD